MDRRYEKTLCLCHRFRVVDQFVRHLICLSQPRHQDAKAGESEGNRRCSGKKRKSPSESLWLRLKCISGRLCACRLEAMEFVLSYMLPSQAVVVFLPTLPTLSCLICGRGKIGMVAQPPSNLRRLLPFRVNLLAVVQPRYPAIDRRFIIKPRTTNGLDE